MRYFFLLRMMKTPVHLFLELAKLKLHGVKKKLGRDGRGHSSLCSPPFHLPRSRIVSYPLFPFIRLSVPRSLPLLPSPFFHVWHFKLNPPKKRRRRRGFFFGGCDRSCDANEDDDDIEWNSGGDGKRKDAEVAKWDEGEGSEEKKVGAWASSSSSRNVSFAHFVTCPLLDFCQRSVGVKEGKKKPTVKMGKREKKPIPPSPNAYFQYLGVGFTFQRKTGFRNRLPR